MNREKNEERLVAEIPSELKRLLDQDTRSNKQIVVDLIQLEYAESNAIELQRKIDRKNRRVENLQSQIHDLEEKVKQEKDEIETLKAQKQRKEERKQEDIRAVAQGMRVAEYNYADEPVICHDREWLEGEAQKIGCSVRELKEAALEEYDG